MAVPASGTLSMQDFAQERLNSTYGSGNVSGPISMYNLVNGGNTGGAVTSGNTYPAVNTACTPNPAENGAGTNDLTLTNIYVCCGADPVANAYFKSSQAANAAALANGDTLYNANCGTTGWMPSGYNVNYAFCQAGDNTNNTIAGAEQEASFFVNASGVISNLQIT